MRVAVSIVIMIVMLFGATPLAAAKPGSGGGGGGGSTTTVPVTSAVHDGPVVGDQYRIRSDFANSGTNTYYDGVDGVVSYVGDIYQLNMHFDSTRKMFVDLGDPVDPSEVVPVEVLGGTSGFVAAKFLSQGTGMGTMKGVGSAITRPFPFAFYGADGAYYQLRMNSAAEPGTVDANFTCTAVAGANQGDPTAQCVAWRAVPASADGRGVGRLYRQGTQKGRVQYTELGDYFVTYEVTFTNP